MKHSHTPGPWKVVDYGHDNIVHIEHEPGASIAQAGGPTTDIDLAHANARLIAAAPTLLEIAKAYRNLLRTYAHTDGQVATFAHISDVIEQIEG